MRRIAVGGALLCVAAVLAALGLNQSGVGAASAGIGLQPASQAVAPGSTVEFDVAVSGVNNLAGWELRLRFDTSVLEYASFTPDNTFLESSGRNVSCPSPFLNAAEDEVQFGCASFGLTPPGASGSGTVGTVTFNAVGSGTSDVEIVKAQLSNPNGDSCCGLPATGEAAVRVVAQGEDPNSAELPSTPTPNVAKLTPTVPAGAPTEPPLLLGEETGGGAGDSGVPGETADQATTGGTGVVAPAGGNQGATSPATRGAPAGVIAPNTGVPVAGTGAAGSGSAGDAPFIALSLALAITGASLIARPASRFLRRKLS